MMVFGLTWTEQKPISCSESSVCEIQCKTKWHVGEQFNMAGVYIRAHEQVARHDAGEVGRPFWPAQDFELYPTGNV